MLISRIKSLKKDQTTKQQLKQKRIEQFRINTINTITILRHCYFFIMAAFLNTIFPVILCIILSYTSQLGLQSILGIGRSSYFTITFCQLGITFALSVNFLYKKYFMKFKLFTESEQRSLIISNSLRYVSLIGIVMVIVYSIAAYMYMYYSTNLPNVYIAYTQGMNYVYGSDPFIFLISIQDVLLLYIYRIKNNSAIFFLIFFYVFAYIFVYLLAVKSPLHGLGAGLGLTFASILTILFMNLYIFLYGPFKFSWRMGKKFFKRLKNIKGLMQEAITGICINLFRGIGLLIISFSIFDYASTDIVPMAYNLGIIFLLNYMYLISFMGMGFSDTIKYYYVYYPLDDKTRRTFPFYVMALINLLTCALVTYICSIATYPLAVLYTQNDAYLPPLEIPQFASNMPTIVSDKLPPTSFPPVPSNYFSSSANKKTVLEQYLKDLINNPTNNLQLINWVEWFKNNSSQLNQWILNNPQTFFSWLEKYEYYASCSPNVVNAFVNLRTQKEIEQPTEWELMIPELSFNAKSMIYLGAFGCAYSTYYIFSAARSALTKEFMPPFIIVAGSFLIIIWVLCFGASFTMLLNNWTQNPFRNLDAFTFPLMTGGFVLLMVAYGEFSIEDLKLSKQRKKELKNRQFKNVKVIKNGIII